MKLLDLAAEAAEISGQVKALEKDLESKTSLIKERLREEAEKISEYFKGTLDLSLIHLLLRVQPFEAELKFMEDEGGEDLIVYTLKIPLSVLDEGVLNWPELKEKGVDLFDSYSVKGAFEEMINHLTLMTHPVCDTIQ